MALALLLCLWLLWVGDPCLLKDMRQMRQGSDPANGRLVCDHFPGVAETAANWILLAALFGVAGFLAARLAPAARYVRAAVVAIFAAFVVAAVHSWLRVPMYHEAMQSSAQSVYLFTGVIMAALGAVIACGGAWLAQRRAKIR